MIQQIFAYYPVDVRNHVHTN